MKNKVTTLRVGIILTIVFVSFISTLWAWYPVSGISVCSTICFKDSPQITSDSAGGAFTVWVDYRNSNVSTSADNLSDIYAQKINSEGTLAWGVSGLSICTASSNQTLPQIISDNAGGAICAWDDARGEIYTQRINSTGSTLWELNGIPVSTTNNYLGNGNPSSQGLFFNLIPDGNGGAILVWMDGRNGGMYTRSFNIYAQRVNSNGTTLWTPIGIAICTAVNGQENPGIVSDGSGGAIISWQDDRSGSWQGYVQRVNSMGSTLWQDDGIPFDNGNYIAYPEMVSDGAGGAIITWGNGDIDAQRISSSGTTLWGTNGIVVKTVSNSSDNGSYPALASDGNGGAIIAWVDSRYTTGIIYSQRVNSSGSTLWTDNGIHTSFDSDEYYSQTNIYFSVGAPVILSDNAGGAIITWLDTAESGTVNYSRLYGQRVDPNGNLLWSTAGVGISGSGYNQQLTSDGSGGVIATWQDPVNGYNNIYVQQINSTGSIPTSVPERIWELLGE